MTCRMVAVDVQCLLKLNCAEMLFLIQNTKYRIKKKKSVTVLVSAKKKRYISNVPSTKPMSWTGNSFWL